jgi:hypothetical protein
MSLEMEIHKKRVSRIQRKLDDKTYATALNAYKDYIGDVVGEIIEMYKDAKLDPFRRVDKFIEHVIDETLGLITWENMPEIFLVEGKLHNIERIVNETRTLYKRIVDRLKGYSFFRRYIPNEHAVMIKAQALEIIAARRIDTPWARIDRLINQLATVGAQARDENRESRGS